MKIKIKQETEVEVKTLHVRAGVRYWEDARVNGVADEKGDLMPCRLGDYWSPIIDIETGKIINWITGNSADIHYKVCDDGVYTLKDEKGNVILVKEGYVIDSLSIGEEGFGDYIILKVGQNGIIKNWKFNIDDFLFYDY